MKVEDGVRIVAGSMILLSLLLAVVFSYWWLLLTAFVGANLIQSAFTGICPAAKIMKAIGLQSAYEEGEKVEATDAETVGNEPAEVEKE